MRLCVGRLQAFLPDACVQFVDGFHGEDVRRQRNISQREARPNSALDHIERKPGEARLLVARLHIEPGQVHRTDHLV